jgi:nucleoid DNA-binding protein
MSERTKIAFNDIESGTMQDITRQFINKHIYACQSYLVSELMSKEVIQLEDYINFYKSDETIKSEYNVKTKEEIQEIRDNGEDQQEVFEHWLCSDWLIEKLKEQNEPILETDFETWWGRTCTGQSIYLDHNIQELAYEYSYDQRLFEKVA